MLTGASLQAACDLLAALRRRAMNTDAPRPYGLSLARRTASSASATFMIGSVGPNVSSRMISIEWSTSTSTVGS